MRMRPASLKDFLRDSLPKSWQVPVKYHYNYIRSFLEPELRLVHLLVKPGTVAIDVGANRGTYTYCFWKLGVIVKAFEPNRSCLAPLEAWANRKNAVTIYDYALSNRVGEARLFVPIDASGIEHDSSASLRPTGEACSEQPIAVRTMDSFHFADVELIKIDVEGHEMDVLEGATATIANCRPALLIEIEQRHHDDNIIDVFTKILQLGYQGFFFKREALRPVSEFQLHIDQNMHNFNKQHSEYINNFLFLTESKVRAGYYDGILTKFGLNRI